ncbi:MAG TPA: PH domain-containing protein [Candidatus Kapabacteria bacterium]|nr:PH domain-containing protein [Candidatus Kapabacteria bacterium]
MQSTQLTHAEPVREEEIFALRRPDSNLLPLYIMYALLSTVAFPFVMLPLYFKYKTLRYTFDQEGISVSYGILWRRESYTTYSRIQDIHVSRNIGERWLGIGTVDIQTASGASTAEVIIVGIRNYEQVRDFLYGRMRGMNAKTVPTATTDEKGNEEAKAVLQAIHNDLKAIRISLERKSDG